MTDSHFRDGVQYAWDSTSIGWIEKCPRFYQYSMIEQWEPIHKSAHLIFGGHYAKALERFHKYMALGGEFEDTIARVVHEALIDSWEYRYDDQGNRIEGSGAPWMSIHNLKTRENLIRSIVWYLDQFGQDDALKTMVLGDGKPAVELSFTLEIDNDLLLCGHLDRVVTYGDDPYVMDQKTTGTTIAPYFFDQFSPDSQMSLYTFCGRSILKHPIKGVVIDGAQIAVGFTRFERGFTYRTEAQLDEWYEGVLKTIETAQRYTLQERFPMNPASCGNYGGCQYRSVCSKSPELRKNFLLADFKKRPQWNPLERR
jgi:hypothetical protein